MASGLLIAAFIVLFVGILLLAWGIYKIYEDTKSSQTTTAGKLPPDFTGWMFTIAGIVGVFASVVLFVSNSYQGKISKQMITSPAEAV